MASSTRWSLFSFEVIIDLLKRYKSVGNACNSTYPSSWIFYNTSFCRI